MYKNLKDSIKSVIKANGTGAITGDILQSSLLSMVNSLGNGALLKGVAIPSTNPGIPDGPEAYLASGTATFPNFSGFKPVANGVHLITWDGTRWNGETIHSISVGDGLIGDGTPTNPIKTNPLTLKVAVGDGLTGDGTSTNPLKTNPLTLKVAVGDGLTGDGTSTNPLKTNPSTLKVAVGDGLTGDGTSTNPLKTNPLTLKVAVGEGLTGNGASGSPLRIADVKTDGIGIKGKGTVADPISLVEDFYIQTYAYGIRHNTGASTPLLTRIGNMDLHKTLPIQSKMRRCIVKDNGDVAYYLDAQDSSKKEDGTPSNLGGADGQFMVEIPSHFIRFTREGRYMDVMISEQPLAGFHVVPKHYIGAGKMVVDRSTNTGCSVVSMDPKYRGGANQASWDEEPKSQLGMAATNISLTNFREYSVKRGTGWCVRPYLSVQAVYWLYMVEFANLNSQSTFTTALTAEGYKQGGLGEGVTTTNGAKWNNFNGYYPLVKEGSTVRLGNNTGIVPVEVGDSENKFNFDVPSYRGIENPFGHLWERLDGFIFKIYGKDSGATTEGYACADPSKFANELNSCYIRVSTTQNAEGWVKEIQRGDNGCIIPASFGGNSTSYFSDYYYTDAASLNGVATRIAIYGGRAASGALAGLACFGSGGSPASSSASSSARLCFYPQH